MGTEMKMFLTISLLHMASAKYYLINTQDIIKHSNQRDDANFETTIDDCNSNFNCIVEAIGKFVKTKDPHKHEDYQLQVGKDLGCLISGAFGSHCNVKESSKESSPLNIIMGGLLKNPANIKTFLDPDKIFDLGEMIVPGVKAMKGEITTTVNNILPVLTEFPTVMKKLLPTLKEIVVIFNSYKQPSEDQMVKWGKAIYKEGGEHIRNWIKAGKQSPLQSLHKKFVALNLKDKAEEYLTGETLLKLQKAVDSFADFSQLLIDLVLTADSVGPSLGASRRRRRTMKRS